MRRFLLCLAAVLALGFCAVPAMAGEVRIVRDHRTVVKVEHHDVRRPVVIHRAVDRHVVIRHDHDRVVREWHRR
jgi:hypothetical protein